MSLKNKLVNFAAIAVLLLTFIGTAAGWTYTTPPDVECVNGTDAGCKIGNTKWNSTDVVTDFLKGDASNLTAVPAAQLTGTAPLSAIPATLTGKDADTVDGYHLNQDVRTSASPSWVNATVTGLYKIYSGAVQIASIVDGYGCGASYCIYEPWYNPGQIYVKNGSTGAAQYTGSFQDVMNQVTNLSSDSVIKIVLVPNRYAISIPNAPPHNRSMWFNKSNISIDGRGSTIYNDGTGTGKSGSYMKQGDYAVSNIEIMGVVFDDKLGNSTTQSTHQIIGFDYVVNNINIHHNRFENLYNAATIINTGTSPYARNINYEKNWHSKNTTHINGDFTEIMGKNIDILDNYFEESTNAENGVASVAIVPGFGKNMVIKGNVINRTLSGDVGIELDPLDTMSGETYSFSEILISDNVLTHGNVGVMAGATIPQAKAASNIIISNNVINDGAIQLQGGIDTALVNGNILNPGWITLSGSTSGGSNASHYNIKVTNNIVNKSNNVGSMVLEKFDIAQNIEIKDNQFVNDVYSVNINMMTSTATFTNISIEGNLMPKGISKSGTFTNYVFRQNLGASPFNHGSVAMTASTRVLAFGANDIVINSSRAVPPNQCQSTAAGDNWVFANNGTAGC